MGRVGDSGRLSSKLNIVAVTGMLVTVKLAVEGYTQLYYIVAVFSTSDHASTPSLSVYTQAADSATLLNHSDCLNQTHQSIVLGSRFYVLKRVHVDKLLQNVPKSPP